ncbi:MAG: TAXI family TRAP transporter solute-binding subunit [Desulfatiglans sp.]|nr:TAXI family TRAP transporter solute-binding subunit [Desulfatiglans sp.]
MKAVKLHSCTVWQALLTAFVMLFLKMGACRDKVVQKEQREVSFGTGVTIDEELSALSRAIISAINNGAPHFKMRSHENPRGTPEVLEYLHRYDICGLSLDEASQAYHGFFQWKGQPHPQLRLLNIIGVLPISFVAASDSDIKSISDLDGKPLGSGNIGKTGYFKVTQLLKALNIRPQWRHGPWRAQIDLYHQEALDVFLHQGAVAPILLECSQHRPFHILGLSNVELSRGGQSYRGTGLVYPPCSIREGTYPNQSESRETFGLMLGYFTRQDVPEEVGYWMVKAAWVDVWNLSASYKPLKFQVLRFPKLTLEQGPFPLHPGAVRFYREIKLEVPDRLLPPEMR